MVELIKCPEHDEIFELEQTGGRKVKCWIENWQTFVYEAGQNGLTWEQFLAKVKIISFEQLRDNYEVGTTKVLKTVPTIVEGRKPRDIFYPKEGPVEIRDVICLGTCLPGWEGGWADLGGTTRGKSFYGNNIGFHNYTTIRQLGLKVFVCLGSNGLTEEIVAREMNDYIDVSCGWWFESLGHEPDICDQPISERIRWYDFVRGKDPDAQARPVMEMFNMTSTTDFQHLEKDRKVKLWQVRFPELAKLRIKRAKYIYPGWEYAFDERTHDLMMIDCYCQNCDDETLQREIVEKAFGKFVSQFELKHQLIPQLGCFRNSQGYIRPDGIWRNYVAWRDLLKKGGTWNNPYQGTKGMCFYKWETIAGDGQIQEQIARVIEDITQQTQRR